MIRLSMVKDDKIIGGKLMNKKLNKLKIVLLSEI